MDLKSALSVVAGFVDNKATTQGFHTVRLQHGALCAMNGHSGCRVPVEGLAVEAAVPLRDLRRVVGAVENPKLSVKRTSLFVQGENQTSFKLKCFPIKSLLPYPDQCPEDQWAHLTGGEMSSLAAVSDVVDSSSSVSTAGLGAVRITPKWAAAATQSMLVALHQNHAIEKSVSVTPEALAGLAGTEAGGSICVSDNKLWVRDEATKQVRWSQALATPWPDSIVDSMLPTTANAEGRIEGTVSLTALLGLAANAKLLTSGEEYGRISVLMKSYLPSRLCMAGDFSRGSFSGEVDVVASGDVPDVGISPLRLDTILSVLSRIVTSTVAGDTVKISFGGGDSPQPIVVEGGNAQTLLMPVILP